MGGGPACTEQPCVYVRESECVVGKHGHYADFLFSFKMLEEYFLFLSARQSSATYAAHFYATARVVTGTEIWESGQLWVVAC